jgi:hypothetical protein
VTETTEQEPADGRQPVFNIVEADRVSHVEAVEELADKAVPMLYVLTPDRLDVWAVPRTDEAGPQQTDVTYRIDPSGVLLVRRANDEVLMAYSPRGWLDLTVASGVRSVLQG